METTNNASTAGLFESFEHVRSTIIGGNRWYVGREAANVLGYKKPIRAVIDHVSASNQFVLGRRESPFADTPNRGITMISENGLCELVRHSRKAAAYGLGTDETCITLSNHYEQVMEELTANAIKRMGGDVLKLVPNNSSIPVGSPDCLCSMPDGSRFYVEFKSLTGTLRPWQAARIRDLRAAGNLVFVIKGEHKAHILISLLRRRATWRKLTAYWGAEATSRRKQ